MNKVEAWLNSIHEDTSPVDSIDSGYRSSSFETPVSAPPSVSDASRRSSPKATPAQILKDLGICTPPIENTDLEGLPSDVAKLRLDLVNDLRKSVIPIELRHLIMNAAPRESCDIPDDAYSTDHQLLDLELLRTSRRVSEWASVWGFVYQIKQEAAKCSNRAKDEAAWCESVVYRVLRHTSHNDLPVAVLNVQTKILIPNGRSYRNGQTMRFV